MARRIIYEPARGLSEFRLLTNRTTMDNLPYKVSLRIRLARVPGEDRFIHLNIPLISAAMQAVSGTVLAIALAQNGGISIIPRSIPIEKQVGIIGDVKRCKAGFQDNVITLSPDDSISKVVKIIRETGYSTFPVTDDGTPHGKLIGIITEKNFDRKKHLGLKIKDRMKTKIDTAPDDISLKEANRLLVDYGHGFLPVIDKKGNLKYVVFKSDVEKHLEFPSEVLTN